MVHMSTLTEESCEKVRFLAMSVLFAHCTEPCPERGFISRLEKSSTMTVKEASMVSVNDYLDFCDQGRTGKTQFILRYQTRIETHRYLGQEINMTTHPCICTVKEEGYSCIKRISKTLWLDKEHGGCTRTTAWYVCEMCVSLCACVRVFVFSCAVCACVWTRECWLICR